MSEIDPPEGFRRVTPEEAAAIKVLHDRHSDFVESCKTHVGHEPNKRGAPGMERVMMVIETPVTDMPIRALIEAWKMAEHLAEFAADEHYNALSLQAENYRKAAESRTIDGMTVKEIMDALS